MLRVLALLLSLSAITLVSTVAPSEASNPGTTLKN